MILETKGVPMSLWSSPAKPMEELFPGFDRAAFEKTNALLKRTHEPPFIPFKKLTYQQKQDELAAALLIPEIKKSHEQKIPKREADLIAAFSQGMPWGERETQKAQDYEARVYQTIVLYRMHQLEQQEESHE